MPTPGSENTNKVLDPQAKQDLRPGGTAFYLISFPSDPANVGTFEIVDCVLLIGSGGAVKDYKQVLDEVSFSKVNNSEDFRLAFQYDIPADVVNGDQICNVAKTTASPSKSPASNRKAGPACFVIGGSGRVEKHDSGTGELLDGATFTIHDCALGLGADPAFQPILVTLEDASGKVIPNPPTANGAGLITADVQAAGIDFNGPSGSSCRVTEKTPPPGYNLPPAGQQTVTVEIGARSQTVYSFNDPIIPPDLKLTKTADAGTVNAGEDIGFTITLSNGEGAGTAHNVVVHDPLPTGTGLSWSKAADSADGEVCDIANGSLTCDVGDLAAGSSLSVHITSPTTAQSCSTYQNHASVESSNGTAPEASASVTVLCPGLNLEKQADAPSVTAGDRIGFTITVRNQGSGTATGVTITDPLLSGGGLDWSVAADSADGGKCAIKEGTLGCDFGDLIAGASRSVHVVTPTTAADCQLIRNTASASLTNGDAPGDASDSVTVNCPALTLEKKADAASVSAGDRIGFTITVGNGAGAGTARGVRISDPLPSNDGLHWTVADDSADGGRCTIKDGTLGCDFGDLSAGASRSVHVVTPTTAADCQRIRNTASASLTNGDAPGDASDSVTVNCPALTLEKKADAPSVSAGDQIGFTITVRNAEESGTAKEVTISDPLPSGLDWTVANDSADGNACAIKDGTLGCDFGDLIAGASRSVHVVTPTTAADCQLITNTASASLTNGDVPGDASDSVMVNCPGVAVDKLPDNPVVDAGGQIGFVLDVMNSGPGVARSVVVTDKLPGNVEWAVDEATSNLPKDATCGISGGVLTCNVGDLPVAEEGSAPQVSIHVVAPTSVPAGDEGLGDCATYPNQASASPANGESGKSALVSVVVRCPLGIGLTKTGPARAHVGDTVTYDFSVTNTGYVDLTAVDLVDPICDAGTLSLVSKGDGDAVLAIDTNPDLPGLQREVWTYRCTRVVRASDHDPLPNTATVTGRDADHRATTAQASWSVDILHPAITIDKTANPVSLSGSGSVTYTYVVTNTGDATLSDVLVTDDILGAIGHVGTLAPGESVTMAKTVDVDTSTPPTNIGTATGTDVLGQTVTATDSATISVVLGAVEQRPAPAPELPRTGAPLQAETRAALALIEVGIILELSGRRRRRAGRRAD